MTNDKMTKNYPFETYRAYENNVYIYVYVICIVIYSHSLFFQIHQEIYRAARRPASHGVSALHLWRFEAPQEPGVTAANKGQDKLHMAFSHLEWGGTSQVLHVVLGTFCLGQEPGIVSKCNPCGTNYAVPVPLTSRILWMPPHSRRVEQSDILV